jgi:amino acid adenylation domain-containing protein
MYRHTGPGDEFACISDVIAAWAARTPDAAALRGNGRHLTYRKLLEAADGLADELIDAGIGSDTPVAICLDRSFEFVISALAVLRAGGAFLPLDPEWPGERLQFCLKDSGAPLVVTTPARRDQLANADRRVITSGSPLSSERDSNERTRALPRAENLAYIIYTSGSTGVPKGVEITQGNLCNLVSWHRSSFGIRETDRATPIANLGFDAAIWEIWPYLAAGASVLLAEESVRTSPEALRRWLIDEKITVSFVPTPLAESLICSNWPVETALRFLLTGGDTLHMLPRRDLPFTVVNNYGPTECTVVATSAVVTPGDETAGLPSIGAPISGARVHILGADRLPVRPGDIGEIYIGGAGVGRGYRNRPELTDERFLSDPFVSYGAHLYRTGDLGRLLPNGEIEFHGRCDDQIKLRGHRIEPDEICATLNCHGSIAQSAVVARGNGAEQQLICYVVVKPGSTAGADDLREFLAARLPHYMVPTLFVRTESLPITPNGKLDRAALPLPCAANMLPDAVGCYADAEAASPIEIRLSAIVTELLKLDRVDTCDNFFLLGGHSLLGTQLVLHARDAFGVDLTLRDLFKAQTVTKLASRIEQLILERLARMGNENAGELLAS